MRTVKVVVPEDTEEERRHQKFVKVVVTGTSTSMFASVVELALRPTNCPLLDRANVPPLPPAMNEEPLPPGPDGPDGPLGPETVEAGPLGPLGPV